MKLYHFTAAHMLDRILEAGLTDGYITQFGMNGEVIQMFSGFQWLTTNPSWEQSWSTTRFIQYSRTAFRLEVTIPKTARLHLRKWTDFCDVFGPWTVEALNTGHTPDDWWIFNGRIPPAWIRNHVENPNRVFESVIP